METFERVVNGKKCLCTQDIDVGDEVMVDVFETDNYTPHKFVEKEPKQWKFQGADFAYWFPQFDKPEEKPIKILKELE